MATIHQTTVLPATPQEVFDTFMTSAGHSAFTGEPAEISPEVGAEFSVYNEYATGKNLELIPGKKIVQTWRAGDWPEDAISTLTILLSPTDSGKTQLDFTQTDVPDAEQASIETGWQEWYWEPLERHLMNQ